MKGERERESVCAYVNGSKETKNEIVVYRQSKKIVQVFKVIIISTYVYARASQTTNVCVLISLYVCMCLYA